MGANLSARDFNDTLNPAIAVDHIRIPGVQPDHAIDHEYGHYVQWALQHNSFGGASRAEVYSDTTIWFFLEGFAEFHQFAVRNYVNAHYDDTSDWTGSSSGNAEEAAFIWPYPFQALYESIPGIARRACFIWNVYDGYSDAGFKATRYGSANNDDIGLPTSIFDFLSTCDTIATVTGYKAWLHSTADTAALPSIDSIYNRMMLDSAHHMRPAQIKNLTGWPSFGLSPNPYIHNFAWDYQDYTGSVGYENPPAGVRIYRGGTLMGTATYPATSFSYADNLPFGYVFSATAYNSSGESYTPQTVAFKLAGSHSLSDTLNTLSMHAYPNPANGPVNINVTALTGGLPAWVRVYDQLDNVVATLYEGTPEADMGLRLSFDGSRYPAGTYYVKAQNAIMGWMVKVEVVH